MPISVETHDSFNELQVKIRYGLGSHVVVFKTVYGEFGPIRLLDAESEGCVGVVEVTEKVQALCIALETARQLEHAFPEGSPVRGRPQSFIPEGNFAVRERGFAVRELRQTVDGGPPGRLEPYVVYDQAIPDGFDEAVEVDEAVQAADSRFEAERQALIAQMSQPSPARWWVDDEDDLCMDPVDPWGSF